MPRTNREGTASAARPDTHFPARRTGLAIATAKAVGGRLALPKRPISAFREKRWASQERTLQFSNPHPGVERLFCVHCGTPIAYHSDQFADEIHFFAATLEDPDSVTPAFHVYRDERLS